MTTDGYGSDANDSRRDIFNNTFDREEFAPRQASIQPQRAPSLRTCPACKTSHYYFEAAAAGRSIGYCTWCSYELGDPLEAPILECVSEPIS
jgi:hypothetical protein